MTALHGRLASRLGWQLALTALAVWGLIAPGSARAANQPDQLVIGSKLLIKSDSGDATKNKLVFTSKDDSFELPDPTNDPTQFGAVLRVLDLGQTAGTAAITLAADRWTATNGGFKYKGQAGDPCRIVKIKDDRLVKVVCKGAGVTLTPPFAGGAALALEVGTNTIRYCATFTNPTTFTKNVTKNGKGLLKAKNAPAPAACLACGNGTVDTGEQCDDGNNQNGDCCSATCQLEISGSPCSDGDACTLNDSCDGSGTCSGGTACGNGVVQGACGEQCDPPQDGACPGLCLPDCTCLMAPSCDGDPGRGVFTGLDGTCGTLTNQAACEDAYALDNAGATSCWWDGVQCGDCTPSDQATGDCTNTCHPPVCNGDPARTFAGGPNIDACSQFDGNQSGCEGAFNIGDNGAASCFYDTNTDLCASCEAGLQADGACVNSCATCPADPTRTIYAGGPGTSACHQFDGDQVSCESAFHRTTCGTTASCFYDSDTATCDGCGPSNELDGRCSNSCTSGPTNCAHDPSRTLFAGGPNTQACHQYDGDPTSCQQAYHRDTCGKATSCYYDFAGNECLGCGPTNRLDGACVNTCTSGPVTCPNDPSRTVLAGLPNSQGCQEFGLVVGTASCDIAFTIGNGGAASCYYDSFSDACRGCGPVNEGNGECLNTCQAGPIACPADPGRTVFAGGPNTAGCAQFDGDQTGCESVFQLTGCGIAACYYQAGTCTACDPVAQANGDCTNTCKPPSCPGDLSRTVFAGGPQSSACHQFDGDQATCEQAFHLGQSGPASCYYDVPSDECRGCGPNNQQNGDCVNTCPDCTDDPARTIFAGGPNTQACHQFDGNQTSCESAFHYDQCLRPTSCFYDGVSCSGCGPANESNFACIETCTGGPPTCEKDASRTLFAGGPNTQACHQYDGNPTSCNQAFHEGQSGIASCFYDYSADECLGCGPNNEQSGSCINTCRHGAPPCLDPSRTAFLGGPSSVLCDQFDGNQATCEQAFLFDECYTPTPCFYSAGLCRSCELSNQLNGDCLNTCETGPTTCGGDSSRTVFAGGPQSGACHQFDGDQLGCLSAFHLGQCGVASCYFDGVDCNGCGPNNFFSNDCFNTCEAP